MTITQIRYFLEVAEQMSFTGAASKLYVVQQVVSKQVRRLEEEIGCSLFYRKGKRLELTAAGEMLYLFWQRTLKEQEIVLQQAKAAMQGSAQTVRIGTLSISSVQDRISAAISVVSSQVAGWKFSIENGSYRELNQKLTEGKLDCIVSLEDENKDLPKDAYEEQTFLELWPSLVISKHHPMYREGVTVKDLEDTTFYILSRKFSRMAEYNILKYCELSGVQPKKIQYFDDVNSMEIALCGGTGAALIYAEFFRNPSGILQVQPLHENPWLMSTKFSIAYHKNKKETLRPFIDALCGE